MGPARGRQRALLAVGLVVALGTLVGCGVVVVLLAARNGARTRDVQVGSGPWVRAWDHLAVRDDAWRFSLPQMATFAEGRALQIAQSVDTALAAVA